MPGRALRESRGSCEGTRLPRDVAFIRESFGDGLSLFLAEGSRTLAVKARAGFLFKAVIAVVEFFRMNLPSFVLALLFFLLVVGCATKEPPPTPAETNLEKYDTRGRNKRDGRIP